MSEWAMPVYFCDKHLSAALAALLQGEDNHVRIFRVGYQGRYDPRDANLSDCNCHCGGPGVFQVQSSARGSP